MTLRSGCSILRPGALPDHGNAPPALGAADAPLCLAPSIAAAQAARGVLAPTDRFRAAVRAAVGFPTEQSNSARVGADHHQLRHQPQLLGLLWCSIKSAAMVGKSCDFSGRHHSASRILIDGH